MDARANRREPNRRGVRTSQPVRLASRDSLEASTGSGVNASRHSPLAGAAFPRPPCCPAGGRMRPSQNFEYTLRISDST